MSAAFHPDSGTTPGKEHEEIRVPDTPDFDRLPFRAPEPAVYREAESAPPRFANNPLYLAIPAPRSVGQVKKLMEAGNPALDPEIRSLSPAMRRERIDDLDGVVFALRRHIDLEEMIMTTIRNSFASRNWSPRFIEQSALQAGRCGLGEQPAILSRGSSVGAGSLFGDVGLGKTISMMMLLMGCPQTILHTEFRGMRLGIQQVVWLYLSMPPKASVYGLLSWIASTLDYILKTHYRDDVDRARNQTAQVRVIARALAIHAVGVIFLDELQNVGVGSDLERKILENTLQELINYTNTRWVFVGTNAGRGAIRSAALLRRMCGERGRIVWHPFEKLTPEEEQANTPSGAYDPSRPKRQGDGEEFVRRVWAYTVTRIPTPLDDERIKTVLQLAGGVPDNMKRLITAAEGNVIGKKQYPDEQLTVRVLTDTMRDNFSDEFRRFQNRHRLKLLRPLKK